MSKNTKDTTTITAADVKLDSGTLLQVLGNAGLTDKDGCATVDTDLVRDAVTEGVAVCNASDKSALRPSKGDTTKVQRAKAAIRGLGAMTAGVANKASANGDSEKTQYQKAQATLIRVASSTKLTKNQKIKLAKQFSELVQS